MDAKAEFIVKWCPQLDPVKFNSLNKDLTSLIQEESIEFGEWLRNNEWSFAAFENEWVNLKDDKLIFKTTSELYNSKEYQEYRNKQ